MSVITSALATAALAVAIGVAVAAEKRHKRVRKRLARLEDRDAELLRLLKSVAARTTGVTPVTFRSQFGEDLLILELLGWPNDGYFIEVGGYDGITNSTSAALEQLGWTGLLVEPVPELCALACTNRPAARVEHAALGKRGSTGTARLTHFQGPPGYDESSHLQTADSAATRRPPADTPARTIDVPLTTLDDLLADTTDRVDAASIDVEGHELDVLDGFDLDRYRPAILLVEDHSRAGTGPINDALIPRGYTQAGWLAWNRVMIRTDRADVLDRARALGMLPPDRA